MAKFNWNPESRRKLQASFQAHTQKEKKKLATALSLWADDTKGAIQGELVRIDAKDQGMLMAATDRTQPTMEPNRIKVTVFNNMEYASVIEFGRRPGKHPPLLPLVGWSGRKGITKSLPRNITFGGVWAKYWAASGAIFRAMKNRKGTSKSERKPIKQEILDLLKVRLIANKIYEKGTKGKHPFTKVYERKRRTFVKDIAALCRMMK
jgi:hypothetical protein